MSEIIWTRKQPGWYEADAGGSRWRIVSTATSRWEVLRSEGAGYDVVAEWPESLAEAKLLVRDDVRAVTDPQYAARREARRARRAS